MVTVIENKGNEYLCTFSVPESGWIHDLAKSMGITTEAVLGAAINKGLCYYVESFLKEDIVDKIKDQIQDEIPDVTSDAKDHKTYNKGPCKG